MVCKYCTSTIIEFVSIDELEYWEEADEELDTDFPLDATADNMEPPDVPPLHEDVETDAVVWWVVAFTCVFQTLHSLSSSATQWLLKFFAVLLAYLGRHSEMTAKIARALPSSLYLRNQ